MNAAIPEMPGDHPLAGCQRKLWRAHEHFEVLQEEVARLGEAERPTFRVEAKPNTQNMLWMVVDTVARPDLKLAVMLGDIVHNVRSSLDHLVFELAFLGSRGKLIPKRTAFPVCYSRDQWESKYVQETLLKGMLKRHRTIIYQAQPCYRKRSNASHSARRRRKRSAIADLHNLWNDDKHRMILPAIIAPTEVQPKVGPFRDCRPRGSPTLNLAFLGQPMESETEIMSIPVQITGPDPSVEVKVQIRAFVGLRNGWPLLQGVADIANYVQGLVGLLTPEFETPRARELWGLPRGGWVERAIPKSRVTQRGWRLEAPE